MFVVIVACSPTAPVPFRSSYGGSIGADPTCPSQLSKTAFRLGMQAVRIERPVEICSQMVGHIPDHVESE